uniref:Uncharacterized protein n=1 Tax=Arundo donax TaxID=35708 RepID=A0A0A9GL54_ARUDO
MVINLLPWRTVEQQEEEEVALKVYKWQSIHGHQPAWRAIQGHRLEVYNWLILVRQNNSRAQCTVDPCRDDN